jgi:hypothetical protein
MGCPWESKWGPKDNESEPGWDVVEANREASGARQICTMTMKSRAIER